jgi:gluconokinase
MRGEAVRSNALCYAAGSRPINAIGCRMIVVVMGVAGSGKTTVGRELAALLGCTFLEGDQFHSPGNLQKMAAGIALTDEDRAPWYAALRTRLQQAADHHEDIVLACSALKAKYRQMLMIENRTHFVYLRVERELLAARVERRENHFFSPTLLQSQLETLEEPSAQEALRISVQPDDSPRAVAERIVCHLKDSHA